MEAERDTFRPKIIDQHSSPIVERRYDPASAEKFVGKSAFSALRMAGKDLSDSHKVERFRELGHDMSLADINRLEAASDDPNDRRVFRDDRQPGHPAVDRVFQRGLTVNGEPIPALEDKA